MEKEPEFIPEQEAEKNIINIGSREGTEIEDLLSNFAHTPFELDGVHYESVEGFWQSIKFPESSKERIETAGLVGGKAKRAGKLRADIKEIEYQGQTIEVGSPQHHELMKKAIRAKLVQNPRVLELLLETKNRPITHILKNKNNQILPDSRTIPGAILAKIVMELREEFTNQAKTE